MRFAIFLGLTAVLVTSVNAQISAIPSCALNCLLTGIISTGCATTDFVCSCSKQDFINSAAACIQGACSPEDVEKAKNATRVLCRDNGIEIVFPDETPTSAPPPSTSATPPPSSSPPPATTAPPPSSTQEPSSSSRPPVTSQQPPSSSPPPVTSVPPPASTDCPAGTTVTITAPGGTVTVPGPVTTIPGPGTTVTSKVTVTAPGTTVVTTKTVTSAPQPTCNGNGGGKKCIGPCLALECCFNWKKGRTQKV